MSKPQFTIAQIHATEEGQYINGEVFVTLTNPKPAQGKGPSTATLTDHTGTILGKFWGGGIEHWAGKRVKLSGQGMQRKAYKGVPELSVGQKAEMSYAGAPGAAAQASDNPDLEAAPQAKPPQQSWPAPTPTTRGLGHYTSLYSACIGAAVNAVHGSDLAGDREAVRQVATAFFIQGLRDNIEVPENVPF